MKQFILSLVLISSLTAVAQDNVPAYKRNYMDKNNNFVEKTRDKLEQTTEDLFSTSNAKEDGTVKIGGAYYMHIYSTNLYKGSDGTGMKQTCMDMFTKRFPTYKVTSCALPQTSWMEEKVEKGKSTVGYVRFMCCYIVAYDGDSGYINARFVYKDYKDVGKNYVRLTEYSPKFDRVDYLSKDVYEKLLKK